MSLYEQWCEAGFSPDSFWTQTPRTIRFAMKGYRERIYKAVEIAGGKVNREGGAKAQTQAEFSASMDAWAAATRHLA